MRPAATPLDRLLAAADDVRDLKAVAAHGLRYASEIYAPNIKEPFSIANRRDELVAQARSYQRRRGARRAA